MKGIDSLKKWSEETNEYVIGDKKGTDVQKGTSEKNGAPKDTVEEIDLLGLGEETPQSLSQQLTTQTGGQGTSSSKNKLPPPPGSTIQQKPAQSEDNFDLLGTDFGAPQTTPSEPIQPAPLSNLDLFDLNLNL